MSNLVGNREDRFSRDASQRYFIFISDLVISQLQRSQAVEETVTDLELEQTMSEVMAKVKDIALTTKKSVQSASADE